MLLKFNLKMEKFLVIVLGIHIVANNISTALTSFTSVILFTSFLVYLVMFSLDMEARKELPGQIGIGIGIDWAFFGFILIAVLGAFFNDPDITDKLSIFNNLLWILYFFALGFIMKTLPMHKMETLLSVLWITILVLSIYGIYQYISATKLLPENGSFTVIDYPRASGFVNTNTYAYCMGMSGLLALGFFFTHTDNLRRNQILVVSIACSIALIATVSRIGIMTYFLTILLFLFLLNRRWFSYGCVLIATGISLLLFLSQYHRGRFIDLFNFESQSVKIRLQFWESSFEIFKDNPLIGVGYGEGYKYLAEYFEKLGYTEFTNYIYHPHNNYLKILAENGALGFIFYSIICIFFLLLSWHLYRKGQQSKDSFVSGLGLGGMGAQLYFHLCGLTDSTFADFETRNIILIIWAFSLATARHKGYSLKLPSFIAR